MRLLYILVTFAAWTVPAMASGDAAAGEEVFRKCKACHQVGDVAKHRTGPILNGVVGAKIAAQEGFNYSDALIDLGASGAVWDEGALDAFLERPKNFAPGTKMSFVGLKNAEERVDIIAYLSTFSGVDPAVEIAVAPEILALEGDVAYGEYLSSECTTCHQADGSAEGIPAVVGLETEIFVTAMHAYRGGAREHPVMQMIAGRLSDEEIASLAAYFQSLND